LNTWNVLVDGFFNARVAREALPSVIAGFGVTLELGLLVAITGGAGGLFLAVVRSAQWKPVNLLIALFADFFRTIPPLVLIVLLYFGAPGMGVSMSGFLCAWIALALILVAFTEEIFWAGIVATPKGQWEASRSTGLTSLQTLAWVVLPQAARMTIAPLTNRAIVTMKGTAYASVVAVPEILGAAQSSVSTSFNATPLLLGAVAYLVLFIPLIALGRRVERRFEWKARSS
jgi:polar amino acid transport system permease protein